MMLTKVVAVRRRLNTVNGNPRWTLSTEAGEYDTARDSQVAYDVTEGLVGQDVALKLRGGEVTHLVIPEQRGR